MAYSKTTWTAGDKITSTKLNNLETGIENVVTEVSTLSGRVDEAVEKLSAAESLITTNKETIEQNAADIAANVTRIQEQANAAAAHIAAAETAIEQINGNVTAIANLRTDVDTLTVTANGAKTKSDANETAISSIDSRVTALEGTEYLTKGQLTGLVAVDGVNVSSAKHVIQTKKNGAVTCESMLWNESSGGGAQVKDIENDMISFIGANRGFSDQKIYAQFYAKKISTNVGCRVNFTDTGAYMTLNKANGSYSDGDLLMTKSAVNDLLAAALERISTLESEVATLKANGAVLSE